MTEQKPLYEDNKIKIDPSPTDTEGHYLEITVQDGKTRYFHLQRGELEDMARATKLEFIRTVDDFILNAMREGDISFDGLHNALQQAYQEEENLIKKFFQDIHCSD
ncbi:hypothetical protein JW851_02730 [Candidatus Woesearchaeota archaeon]|nr:hypothetical protein [Candidatus Woesearchaeota archaeon]